MRLLMLMLAGTALSVSACKRGDNPDASANQDMTVANTDATDNGALAAPVALPTTAQGFANAAAASDRFEIESSQVAQASGQSAAVKSFAKQMITAHTATSAKLKSTLAGMSPALTPNSALNPDQQALLDGLKGKTGANFDAAYGSAQQAAHQKTLDALNAYASGGDNPALQTLAKGMIPTVTAHLNLAKGLK
jgi:putative membrane protein